MTTAVIDPAALAGQKDRVHTAVRALCDSRRQSVARDDGSTDHVVVPGLLAQARDALGGDLVGGSVPGGLSSTRSLIDLALLDILRTVAVTVRMALVRRGASPRDTLEGQVRQLVSIALRDEQAHLPRYAAVFEGWVSTLTGYLHAGDNNGGTSIRLRGCACPRCCARTVRLRTDEGAQIVGPLLVEVRGGLVRGISCTACGAYYWRGDEVLALARALGCMPLSEMV